jgi:hypothetical protein
MGGCCETRNKGYDFKYSWHKVEVSSDRVAPVARSSHGVSVMQVNGTPKILVFGGEHTPRHPIDSTLHCLYIEDQNSNLKGTWEVVQVNEKVMQPVPRVAHAQAVIGTKLYMYGGREGPNEEETALNDLWVFDWETKEWKEISYTGDAPCARSYH